MAKKTKKPKERLINSVLDDLKNETAEPSMHLVNGPMKSNKKNDENQLEATRVLGAPGDQPKIDQSEMTVSVFQSDSSSEKTTIISSVGEVAQPPLNAEQNAKVLEPRSDLKTPSLLHSQKQRASAYEAQFLQAENLKIAQQRIIELEKDIERLRKENEILASANDIGKNKIEDLSAKVQTIERQKFELKEINESELQIFRHGLIAKDEEIQRLRNKVEELDSRLANDLRKIRVRERELENRLELSKLEKAALLRSKDETILELKRRGESLEGDLENFQHKIIELNHKIEENQEQFSRTIRALRIALTNLEVNENTSSITLAPLKKAQ